MNKRVIEMELKFRLAKEDDISQLIQVTNTCFDENTNLDQALKVFQKSKMDGNQLYLIGELNGKIIAHTKITIVPTIFTDMETYAILNHVCVLPDYRRHHIATHMMNVIKKICKEKNCISIKLWSKNFRIPAHTCYLNEGFEIIDAKFFELKL